MVGFNRRFIPLMRVAKAFVEGEGAINTCIAEFHKYYADELPYYRGAVDILTCDAIHAVDVLRWACGEWRRVLSVVKRFGKGYDNAFYALVAANWASGGRVYKFEFHTLGASAYVNPDDRALLYRHGKLESLVFQVPRGS